MTLEWVCATRSRDMERGDQRRFSAVLGGSFSGIGDVVWLNTLIDRSRRFPIKRLLKLTMKMSISAIYLGW